MKMFNDSKEEVELLEIEPKKPRKNKRIKKSEMSADALLDKSFVEPENKKVVIVVSIIIILLIVGIIFFVNYISGTAENKKHDNNNQNKVNTTEEVDNTTDEEHSTVGEFNEAFGSLFLYKKDDQIIVSKELVNNEASYNYLGMYNCQSEDCDIYKVGESYFNDFDSNTIVLKDGGMFIYNYKEDKILTYKYNYFYPIRALEKVYLIGMDENSGANIYSIRGTKITTDGYESIGLINNNQIYEYDNNVIAAKKDGKWGLITIRTNEVILDFKWDNLYLSNNDLYLVVKDNEYYVLNNDSVQLTDKGYPLIIEAFSEYFLSIEDNKLHIRTYEGKDLIDTPIDLTLEYNRYDIPKNITVEVKNIAELLITIKQSETETVKYIFNSATYVLEQTE